MRIKPVIYFLLIGYLNLNTFFVSAQKSVDSTRFGFKVINDSLSLAELHFFEVYTYNYTKDLHSGFLAYLDPTTETIFYGDKDSLGRKQEVWIECKSTKNFLVREHIKLNPEVYLKKQEILKVYFYHNDTLLFTFDSNASDNKVKSMVNDLTFGTWSGNYDPLKIRTLNFNLATTRKNQLDALKITFYTYSNLIIEVSLQFKKSRITQATGHSVSASN